MSATVKVLSGQSSDMCNCTVLLGFLKNNRAVLAARLSQEQIDFQIREECEAWDLCGKPV
jgi:hypothetical protein